MIADFDSARQTSRVEELEQELAVTRQHLQSVIDDQEAITEELQTANEEIQSGNEELRISLDTLSAAKEELLSSNDELAAANQELHSRNEQLVQANSDFADLLSSARIPMLVLGADMTIRHFTPQAERVFNLLPTDAGRPVTDLKLKIRITDLEKIVRSVLEDLSPVERDVQDREGRVWSMCVRPYRSQGNRITGVVITLFDLTEHRRSVGMRFRLMFENSSDGILICEAASAVIVDVNPAARRLLGYTQAEMIGRSLFDQNFSRQLHALAGTFRTLQEDSIFTREIRFLRDGNVGLDLEIRASTWREGERPFVQFMLRETGSEAHLGMGRPALAGVVVENGVGAENNDAPPERR
jgi:PAS domain S-box-containing protein